MNFWTDYTARNPKTAEEADAVHLKAYGITRTELNQRFLGDLPRDLRILEVGCGTGTQLLLLRNMGFVNLRGVDSNAEAVRIARWHNDLNVAECQAQHLPDIQVDLVFTSGLLIHIPPDDLGQVMDEIHRVSRRYIFGLEQWALERVMVPYRGLDNMMWNADYSALFQKRFPLKVVKEAMLPYIEDAGTLDQIYLLEKESP